MRYYIREGYTFIVGKNKVLHSKDEEGNRVVIDDKKFKIDGQEHKLEFVDKPKPAEKRYTLSEVVKLILSAVIDSNSEAIAELSGLMNPVNEALGKKGLELSVSQIKKEQEVKVDQPKPEQPKPGSGTGERSSGPAAQNAPITSKVEQSAKSEKITIPAPKKS